MKQTAAEESDGLLAENEVLKAKISELESQVNTLSRSIEEIQIREKVNYERKINELNQENQKFVEEFRIKLEQVKDMEM